MTERPRTIDEPGATLGASRASVTRHLAKLPHAGVVDMVRQGRTATCTLRGGHVELLVREGLNHADHVVSGERPQASVAAPKQGV